MKISTIKITNNSHAYLQNLQNSQKVAFVGFVGVSNKTCKNICEINNDLPLVNTDGLPMFHCKDNPYGDSKWIDKRLRRVVAHKRALLASEYALRYMDVINNEPNEVVRENKARRIANLWLLEATSFKNIHKKCSERGQNDKNNH